MHIQSPALFSESVVFHFTSEPTAAALFVSTGGFEVDAILIAEPDHEKSGTPIPKARPCTNTGLASGRRFSEQNTDEL